MTLAYVYDPLLNDTRPATRAELEKMQQDHWKRPQNWDDWASYRKYCRERLRIRKALADLRSASVPSWTRLSQE